MTARIKINMDDEEVQKALDDQRKKNEAVEKSYVGVAKQILKNEKNQLNAAKRIIRSQRDEKKILGDKIKSLRLLGQTDASQKAEANAAIRKLIVAERERQESIEETERTSTEAFQKLQTQISAGVRKTKELIAAEQTLDQKYDELRLSIKAAFDAGEIGADEQTRAIKSLNAEQEKARDKAKQLGGDFGKAFSVSDVKKFAASFVTVTAAIGVVRNALEFFNQEKDRALGTTDSLSESRRSLRQVSRGDFGQLERRADSLATDREIGITREQARQLLFDARSTGFEGEERIIAAADPVISITDGAAFAGEFRKFFKGDNLSIEQAFNTALAGAAESQFNISDLLPQIRTAAQGALAGGESSDIVAATSALASNFGKSVGDRIRALGTKLATNEETKGLNFLDAVQKLRQNDGLRETIIKDSAELKAVFAKLDQRFNEIRAVDKRIEREQRRTGEDGLIQKAVNEARDESNSGQIEIERRNRIAAEQQRRIAEEGSLSAFASSAKAAKDQQLAGSLEDGSSLPTRAAKSAVLSTAEAAGADSELINVLGNLFSLLSRNSEAERKSSAVVADQAKEQTKQSMKQTQAINNLSRRPALQGVD